MCSEVSLIKCCIYDKRYQKNTLRVTDSCGTPQQAQLISCRVQNRKHVFREAPRRFQDASRTPPRRLYVAFQTPPSGLQDGSRSLENPHDIPRSLQAAPKTRQDDSKTPQHAFRPPPRGLQDNPRRPRDGFRSTYLSKACHGELSTPRTTSCAHMQ